MPTAAQVISSCNRIMLQLEQETLGATADLAAPATIEERLLAAHYDTCAKRIIACHNWHCVRNREALSMAAVDSASVYGEDGWSYYGTLPGKAVAMWGIKMSGCWGPWVSGFGGDYLIESGKLYTGVSDVDILYGWYPRAADYGEGTAYNTTFNTAIGNYLDALMPSLLKWIELEIAYEIEPVLVKDENKRAELWSAIYGDHRTLGARAEAISQNLRENPQPHPYSRDLIEVGMGRRAALL